MKRIVFRVDASTSIGSGHVVRCATLASELAARGVRVHFLSRELPGHYCDWLEQQGFAVTRLKGQSFDSSDDISQCSTALTSLGEINWLVVDHYELDAKWEMQFRPRVRNILIIDDKANRPHDCDLLLDQNLIANQEHRYNGLLLTDAKCLFGPRYALLRPEFAEIRTTQQRVRDGNISRVLVCFGGSDPQGHTVTTLQALRLYAHRFERIDVVVGPANPNREAISAACARLPSAQLHCPAINMAKLLADADLAIGAGGTMNWERACVGVPTLAFGIADNQRPVLESLIEAGYVVGNADIPCPDEALTASWLSCLLDNPALLRGLSSRSATLVDGRGTQRVADLLFPIHLSFRPAVQSDSEDILKWRNDPEIRHASSTSNEIDRNTHEKWFENTITNPQRVLLIAEYAGKKIGVVRFDLNPPEATISVYRVPFENRSGNLIRQSTDWLRMHHPEIRKVFAEVLPHNTNSLAAFRNAGYLDTLNTLAIELEAP